MWYLIWNERKRERKKKSIICFKARVYLLHTNCGRGSALEGCVLRREGGGPQGHQRACLSVGLYQNNTVATALNIRRGVCKEWRRMEQFTGGNKRSETWIKSEGGGEMAVGELCRQGQRLGEKEPWLKDGEVCCFKLVLQDSQWTAQ